MQNFKRIGGGPWKWPDDLTWNDPGAFPIFVPMLIQLVCTFVSAKASLARTTLARIAYPLVRIFPFCACFLRRSIVPASLACRRSTKAYFGAYPFLRITWHRSYIITNLFKSKVVFCVWTILLLITYITLRMFVSNYLNAWRSRRSYYIRLKLRLEVHSTPR